MMGNKEVSLGSSKSNKMNQPKKEKMVYMSISTAILFVLDSQDIKTMGKYSGPILESIKANLNKDEIRDNILKIFNVSTVKKMKRNYPDFIEKIEKLFGNIW